MRVPDEVDQKGIAKLLALSTRQIRNLEDAGLPHRAEGNRKFYPVAEAVAWYGEYKYHREDLSPLQSAELRKKLADAEAAEYELAILRRDYIARKDVGVLVQDALDRADAKLRNAPSRYAGRTAAKEGVPESMRAWQAAIEEVRAELRSLADEDMGPEPEDDDDGDAS